MATIDNLDLDVYRNYAARKTITEQIDRDYRLQEASAIPPQTEYVYSVAEQPKIDILFGIIGYGPWSYCCVPKGYRSRRRSSASRTVPSLDLRGWDGILDSIETQSSEEDAEKKSIHALFQQIYILDGWLGFIMGRRGQFLQG